MKNIIKHLKSFAILCFFLIFGFIPMMYGDIAVFEQPGFETVSESFDHVDVEVVHLKDAYAQMSSEEFLIYLQKNVKPVCYQSNTLNSYDTVTFSLDDCIAKQNHLSRNSDPEP